MRLALLGQSIEVIRTIFGIAQPKRRLPRDCDECDSPLCMYTDGGFTCPVCKYIPSPRATKLKSL